MIPRLHHITRHARQSARLRVLAAVASVILMPVAHGIGPTIEADPETLGSVTDTDSTTRQIATDTSAPRLSLPSPDRVQSPAPEPRGRRIVRQKIDLDNSVTFAAKDSVILIGRDSAFMYGTGNVKYGDIQLDAAQIEMNLNANTVYAVGTPDTAGVMQGRPVFSEGGTDYEANTMRYNFKSRKGIIHDVVTQQGEGYLHSGLTKKADDETYYFENGKYTTCDDRDCPHFYFQITKGKMRPGKDVVTGPTYLVLAGLPLPLALPFGYFPFSESYQSGILVPTFGDDYNRGFYLSDGGYYLAINDNVDLALTGEIYTKGSWGLAARSTYAKRYKFSGNFSVNYLKTILGDKGLPDYSKQTNFQVTWSHSQDSKSNPNMSLSASVNFATSGYTRNDLNAYYSNAFTENTKSSTVNMTYRFPNSKWSLSTSLNVSQRTQDSTVSVGFPNLNITMGQLAPFKRKRAVGAERWYEKIKISYSGQFQNSLTAKQNVFFKKSLIKDWRNGMKHSVPISATFNIFKYFNITPSVSLNDRMYSSKVRRQWDPNAAAEVCDTSYNFYNVWDFNASVSMDTKLYGFFKPLPIFGDKVQMIRHVLTPSVSFSGAPDFSSPFFGYYGSYTRPNSAGEPELVQYSMFPNSVFGVPGRGKTGAINVSLANNVEMKVKTDNDSIGEKKISLIENFTVSQSYNFAADSLNWSNINTSILLRLTKGFNLNLSAVWDVYTYQLNSSGQPVRVNIPRWKAGKGLGRLSSTGTSFSYTFNNDTFKRKNKNDKKDSDKKPDDTSGAMHDRDLEDDMDDSSGGGDVDLDSDGYARWSVPWSLSVNYSIGYGYGNFNYEKMEYNPKITQNLSFSGNIRPAKNWNFSFTASYDFNTHRLAYMNCNISRNLHCFTMRASFVPVGPYKSYNFHIGINSSMLSDLKYDKRSSLSNGVTWY
ncbi:MAG: LPS-assembly protein LptD [Bacteroidales bacterium]|nr:LPS-assembly protein LptD [Bacteroidales bacterium]